jgi:C-terminal processing protease CtpA/Prc
MQKYFLFVALLVTSICYGQTKYEKDFLAFWNDVNDNYAYLDQQKINWLKVKEIYSPLVKEVTSQQAFIKFMEGVINECYNGHISLYTNLSTSNRIIPSGQDIYVEKINHQFVITDLRKGYKAEKSGLKIGDEILLFQGNAIDSQLQQFLPKYTNTHTNDMYQYAIDMLFAGTHNTNRILTINRNGTTITLNADSIKLSSKSSLLETKQLNQTTAYIKINDALGNFNLINLFDQALDSFLLFKNIIIDLTETPSGGNTTVARSIMGRFIHKALPYQQHEFDETAFQTKRQWVEYVTPRKTQFKGNVYVMVGHWTGSMGEGMAIGFDGLKRAKIVGTSMAKLLGAVQGFTMTETNIGFQIPTERLYHINGIPREKFIPTIPTKNIEQTWNKILQIK